MLDELSLNRTLTGLLYFFLFLTVLVFTLVLFYSFFRREAARKEKRWQEIILRAISNVIFLENKEVQSMNYMPYKKLLQNKRFRQYFIDELILSKKNLSGAPAINLKNLYTLIRFNEDSFRKIQSKKWHVKAKGLQELSIMEQEQYVKNIFRLTNHTNEAVRNEAQCALVNFYGFKGFRFLNVIIYPISQWQQIQLLNYLHEAKTADAKQLRKWLDSTNDSVITLALRLATFYNSYEVYNEILNCLQHSNQLVRLSALNYLKKITVKDTGEHIIKCYSSSDRTVQLNVISLLAEIGSQKEIPFLLKQLHNGNDKIKLAAARTLVVLHPMGIGFFQTCLFANREPWKTIFSQILNERAA